jgi:surfeit locus 1 family protein
VPTLVVGLAVLLMVRLGFWQLHRLDEKTALVALYAANLDKPPVPIQALWPVAESSLYRRVTATCPNVIGWKSEAGRNKAGTVGWRHIALCGTGAEGPGLAIDVGLSQTSAAPGWTGGDVAGRLTWAPSAQPLIARAISVATPPSPMVVAADAAPGLEPTAPPDPAAVPNNHLSYALQWFAFAVIALVIYAILLWRRARAVARAVAPGGRPR